MGFIPVLSPAHPGEYIPDSPGEHRNGRAGAALHRPTRTRFPPLMRNSSLIGSFLACLFSLPFFGGGVAMLTIAWLEVVRSHVAVTQWKPVPAYVDDAQLESSRGSKGGTTWQAAGSFTYEFQGEKYTSTRLNFGTGSDNIGTYHQDLVARMLDAKGRNSPLPCRVDPEHPSEAVLDPDWRPEMFLFMSVMGAIFGGVGIGIGIFAVVGLKTAIVDCLASNGGARSQPGRWDEREANIVKPTVGTGAVGAALSLVLIHGATLPLWTKLNTLWHSGAGLAIFSTLALIGALVATFVSAAKLWHWFRYRSARLELQRIPASLGKTFRARLHLPGGIPANRTLEMALRCIERVTTGNGKQSRQSERERWNETQSVPGPFDPRRPLVFGCEIPERLPDTTGTGFADGIRWRFEAKAGPPVFGMRLRFELPVFRAS